jgi:hypothetical protein
MAGLAHIGMGLAAKRIAPDVPVGILVAAGIAIDLPIWGIFALTGLDRPNNAPWSHGLFMATVWSLLAGGIAWLVSREKRTALVIGGLVFVHWVIDFISHPMGFGKALPPDLPLFFGSSPKVGLGLYQNISAAIAFEAGVFLLGCALYVRHLVNGRKKRIKPVHTVKGETN